MSHDRVNFDVDHDVSTAILLVFSGDGVDCLRVRMEEFEEQAITNATCKPKIWKRYVEDTFTVLDLDNVDGFFTTSKQSTAYYSFYHGNRER